MRSLILTFVLAACDPTPVHVVPEDSGRPGRDDTGDTADTADTAGTPAVDCSALPALPIADVEVLTGFTNAEDFALDGEGYHVSLDLNGSLVGIHQDGSRKIILPGAGYGAGTHMLADGRIVFADVANNTIVRVDPATQDSVVLLGGLAYPNGLDVGIDGAVYVAETSSGKVRKIDAETGESTVIAAGLFSPNGVSFGPGFDSLYVGSFGGGVVYRMDLQDDGSWSRPRTYGLTPGSSGGPADLCDTAPLGATCPSTTGYGVGECTESDLGYATCETVYDWEGCDGKGPGDPCTTSALGETLDSVCVVSPYARELFCPSVPAAWVEPCLDNRTAECTTPDGDAGTCAWTYESAPICYASRTSELIVEACVDKALGDSCIVRDWAAPIVGECVDGAPWGVATTVCSAPPIGGGTASALDGLNVDACGNVYGSAYIAGQVLRWSAEGAEAELVIDVRSSWIPNMHFGHGVGGWEENVLYLANRDRSSIYAIPVGVPGHGEAFDPTP